MPKVFSSMRGLACGALFILLSCSALAADAPQHRALDFSVVNGAIANAAAAGIAEDTLKVQQGDEIELKWSSDKAMELHLHGYDIEVKLAPQKPAAMKFKASIPGRFPIEQHGQGPGHHKPVLYLEVRP